MLTQAALGSQEDRLVGLKENVILGRLIPAGTGFKSYQDIKLRYAGEHRQAAAPRELVAAAADAEALARVAAESLLPNPDALPSTAPVTTSGT